MLSLSGSLCRHKLNERESYIGACRLLYFSIGKPGGVVISSNWNSTSLPTGIGCAEPRTRAFDNREAVCLLYRGQQMGRRRGRGPCRSAAVVEWSRAGGRMGLSPGIHRWLPAAELPEGRSCDTSFARAFAAGTVFEVALSVCVNRAVGRQIIRIDGSWLKADFPNPPPCGFTAVVSTSPCRHLKSCKSIRNLGLR